jgi:2-polyprenyl-3-methyl-5-hydroxy-6-metoxy-1,4-benzoquinol methylase
MGISHSTELDAAVKPASSRRAVAAVIRRNQQSVMAQIVAAYDDWPVRFYSWGRFQILRQRFLDEIGQYLPNQGRVLDVGCGFGLFSLYYASTATGLRIEGFDLNARRIGLAQRAAARLALPNVSYEVKDARDFEPTRTYDAAYMLDIIHHVPYAAAVPLLDRVSASLVPGGVLLVKDVDTRPAAKRLFTHVLDWALDPKAPVRYWAAEELQQQLEAVGLRVYRHKMIDILPYPHILYVCMKPPAPVGQRRAGPGSERGR